MVPGPTLVVAPGDRLVVLLENTLEEDGFTEASNHPEAVSWNALAHPNATSLHTHGLHVSSMGLADNVFRYIAPG